MTTIIIKDENSELSLTRVAENLTDMLGLIEDALRGHGFNFEGKLTIEEKDDK